MRIIFTFLLLILIIISVTSCRNGSVIGDGNELNFSGHIYAPETILFPDEMTEAHIHIDKNNIVFTDEKVYFAVNYVEIYSMNVDGSDLFKLPNYKAATTQQSGDDFGSIIELITDSFGNLWVLESAFFAGNIFIRKLDDKGTELLSVDISDYVKGVNSHELKFNIDNEENIYIGAGSDIKVLDNTGDLLFTLAIRDWVRQIVRLPDGVVAYNDWTGKLRKIDVEKNSWSETIEMRHGVYNAFTGIDEFPVLFNIGSSFFAVTAESGEIIHILDFLESDLMFDNLLNAKLLSDGRIMVFIESISGSSSDWPNELVMLTRTPESGLKKKTTLTLAGLNIDKLIRSAAIQFNRTSETHRIHITDYDVFNSNADDNAGLIRLTTEIIAGRIPDILALTGLPFRQYAERGMFVDLGIFLDNDPELKRDDLIGSVLQAAETDSKLYRIFPIFNISTVIGIPELTGSSPGWTMDEFIAVLDANPDADLPMGEQMTRDRFVNLMFLHNIEQFVDWNTGTVHFDRGNFAELLEFANMFPIQDEQEYFWAIDIFGYEMMTAGRQIMAYNRIRDFRLFQINRTFYGGNVVFKGFPKDNRLGSALMTFSDVAVTSQSEHQQEAWEFIRILMSEEFGHENISGAFPVNENIFAKRFTDAVNPDNWSEMGMPNGGRTTFIPALSHDEASRIRELIDSINVIIEQDTALMNIVSECASDFFNRRNSAQEAARIIQSRASIYMAEQSG